MKPKLIKPENTLKKKVGDGGFRADDIAQAQAMIETNDVDFQPAGLRLANELTNILVQISAGGIEEKSYFNDIMYPLMQLKAQGGMFRYHSVSQISHLIIDFLEHAPAVDSGALDIVGAYLKSVRALLVLQIRAVDAPATLELCKALSGACARHGKSARPVT